MEKKKRYSITVKGRVQGVFFRKSTSEKAESLNLTGFVQNKEDGSVYIEAEGQAEQLEELLQWAQQGPPAAKVEAVDHEEKEPADYSGFEVKR